MLATLEPDATATAGDASKTYAEYVAEGRTLWGYDEFAMLIGRQPQSVRKALMKRRQHIREDARRRGVPIEQGRAKPDDVPKPLCYKNKPPRAEPHWDPDDARRWAMMTGKLKADGRTPIPPRSGRRATPKPPAQRRAPRASDMPGPDAAPGAWVVWAMQVDPDLTRDAAESLSRSDLIAMYGPEDTP